MHHIYSTKLKFVKYNSPQKMNEGEKKVRCYQRLTISRYSSYISVCFFPVACLQDTKNLPPHIDLQVVWHLKHFLV